MPPDGQADTAPESLDDLAAFLADNPEALGEDRPPPKRQQESTKPASKSTAEPGDTDEDDATLAPEEDEDSEEDDAKPEPKEGEDEDEDDEERTSEKKQYAVTIKNEDGSDEKVNVTLDELTKGYMRQADYTRKTQAGEAQRNDFAQRGIAALEGQRQRHAEALQANLRAMQSIAGLRSPEEMQQLANNDPTLYTQEVARQQVIYSYLNQTQQMVAAERAESERQLAALREQEMAHAWGVLGNKGIDKAKLRAIYDATGKNYGYKEHEFANVTDPRLVLLMQDANAYRDLKAKTASVTKKAKEAPPLPPQRQTAPRHERLSKQIDSRFKSGRAKVEDLAAYLDLHKF